MPNNPITASVDFDAGGIHHGHLKLPHSDDQSAWGAIMTPVTVIGNGAGPTALLTGGNHGDEYEGPIALLELVNRIDPGRVSGRIIVVPMMNYPAFCAGTRTSPIDRGNTEPGVSGQGGRKRHRESGGLLPADAAAARGLRARHPFGGQGRCNLSRLPPPTCSKTPNSRRDAKRPCARLRHRTA